MPIQELRTEKERTLYTVCLVVSCAFWAGMIIGTLGLGLIYIVSGAAFVLLTQVMFLAALKGNGVRITADQFPDLHARLVRASEKLELDRVPEAYLLNHRGVFNAFATRFLDRNFVVLYAELLEACAEDDGSIDFIIGHEVGHIAFNHTKLAPVLLPARFVPLLGHAYSRACEYSCDRAGTVVAGRSEGAVRGLAVLAAGGRYAKRLNVNEFLKQRLDTGNFWMSVVELAMSHPFLPKRVGAILADTRPEVDVPAVQRNPFAYVVSPMLGGAGAGGGLIVGVMVVGMLAAIAVPSFAKYRAASEDSAAANIRMQQQTDRDLERALDEVRVVRVKDEAPAPVEADAELVAPPPAEKQVERQVERQVVQAQPQRKAKAVKKRVPKRTTTTYRSTSTTNSNDNDNIF